MTDANRAGSIPVGDELVDHLSDDGEVLGSVTRRVMRRANLLHRAVFIIVSDGSRILVHQRAAWKDIWPSFWDLALGGVVGAGEAWDDAAARELDEEAGISTPLDPLGEVRYADDRVQEIARVYRTVSAGPFTFPDGEVADSAWVDFAGLDRWIAERSVCPDSVAIIPAFVRPSERPRERGPAVEQRLGHRLRHEQAERDPIGG